MTATGQPARKDTPPQHSPSNQSPSDHPPSDLQTLAARFFEMWSAPILDRAAVRASLLIAMISLCAIRAYIGLSGVQVYSHDAFGVLDGAWRIVNGQKPHADFYTPLGPLIYMVTAFGLWISHGGAEGFGYSQAVCGWLLGLWSYGLGRRRLGHLPAVLLCLTVVLLSINPSSVGEPPTSTSCMAYNRFGYALIALMIVECVAASDRWGQRDGRLDGRPDELRGGISTGVILGLLLFLKISYFVGGVGLAAALIPCRKQHRNRWYGMFLGFTAVFLAFWTYLGFQLAPMWNDFRMVGGAKRVKVSWFIVDNLYLSVAAYFAFVLAAARLISAAGAASSARAMRVAGVAVCAVGIFLLATNFQFYGLPLSAVMAILVLKELGAGPATGASSTAFTSLAAASPMRTALLLWGSLMVAGPLCYEAMGLGFGALQKREWDQAPHASFHAPVLAGFHSFERGYVDLVNDGLALLNQHRRQQDTVMSLDFSNPFSYALGLKPAPGGATTLHYGGNFTDAHHPAAERLFGQASLVMEAKAPSERGLLHSIPRIYGSYLAAHFHLIGESPGWRLYRRNTNAVPANSRI